MEQSLGSINLADAFVGEQYRLRIPSRLDWVEPIIDHLTGRAVQCGAVSKGRAGRVLLALHEVLTNSIVHGNLEVSSDLKERGDEAFAEAVAARSADARYGDRHVDIRTVYDGEAVRWMFSDQGQGFDVERTVRRLDEGDVSERPSGRGLVLMRAFVDEVRWEDGGRRAVLSVRKGPGEEKRTHQRLPWQQQVRVAPIDADGVVDWSAAHGALTQNLSAEGIALLQSQLQTTDRVLITIPTSGASLAIPAEVRHWKALSDNVVEVGCRFEVPLGREAPKTEVDNVEVAEFLARHNHRHSPRERRDSPRVGYTGCVTVEGPHVASQGFARDLSGTGIAFVTTHPLPLGDVLLTLPQEPGQPPLRLPARIVRCDWIMDGFHDVGARFLSG